MRRSGGDSRSGVRRPWPEWRKRLRHHEITFGLLGVLRDVPTIIRPWPTARWWTAACPTCRAPLRADPALLRPQPVTPGRGPGHGEHTDAVLSELGYSPAEIDTLRTAGALG
jgi:crotonobetainyl-CoA:carnitine CoA-transferase CaiB-like acyl-CoA transferase